MTKMYCGIGINDADYVVQPTVNGVQIPCPYYKCWAEMLKRCYSKSRLARRPTYNDCSVCEEWLTFSKFKAWMETQDWRDKHLDKDILVKGNKIYSPATCVFVSMRVNMFLLDSKASRGLYPIGVHLYKKTGKFAAQCQDNNTRVHIGYYYTPEDANEAWRKYKHLLACKLADEQTDQRVAEALRKRYL